MFRVYTCLTVDHDWRLVLLAVAVCFLASAAAVSLLHRAQATIGRTRLAWLSLDAAAAGCGTWATHFIAMLAYDPGIGAGYNLVVTILSLLIAVLVTGVGLGVALLHFARWTAVLGGAVVGSGIAAMHYTGMMALEVPGRITWVPNLVVACVGPILTVLRCPRRKRAAKTVHRVIAAIEQHTHSIFVQTTKKQIVIIATWT
jgi:NO-binding membrane sensor protein with MHYT domain